MKKSNDKQKNIKKTITKKEKKSTVKNNEQKNINYKKVIIIYSILLLIDVIMIIYFAKHNYVNYVSLPGNERILVSKTRKLLFGRNYITIIISLFFYIYTLLCNKYILQIKNSKKLIISTIIFYLILNISLFYIFTQKIY